MFLHHTHLVRPWSRHLLTDIPANAYRCPAISVIRFASSVVKCHVCCHVGQIYFSRNGVQQGNRVQTCDLYLLVVGVSFLAATCCNFWQIYLGRNGAAV